MTMDLFPTTAEALDALYQSTEDPWGTRSIPEKQVRYEELERFLPEGPHGQALEIACREGDFSARGVTGGVRDDEKRIMTACQEQGPERPGRLGLVLLRYYASRLRTMHRLLTWVNPWRARLLEVQPVDTGGRRTYWEIQALTLWLWRLAGMSSVALLLVLACLLGMPLGFAWLLTLAGLPYSICVLWLQRRADHLTFRAWTK